MDGEVTKVDAKKGWVDVKTPEGRMKLHFPPAALENVKKGDRVTVEIGMTAFPSEFPRVDVSARAVGIWEWTGFP